MYAHPAHLDLDRVWTLDAHRRTLDPPRPAGSTEYIKNPPPGTPSFTDNATPAYRGI